MLRREDIDYTKLEARDHTLCIGRPGEHAYVLIPPKALKVVDVVSDVIFRGEKIGTFEGVVRDGRFEMTCDGYVKYGVPTTAVVHVLGLTVGREVQVALSDTGYPYLTNPLGSGVKIHTCDAGESYRWLLRNTSDREIAWGFTVWGRGLFPKDVTSESGQV